MCVLSIVVVHYDTPKALRGCLGSLYAAPVDFAFEVRVIDNASPHGSLGDLAQEFPQATFQFNTRNLGFARASNQGTRASEGRYVLLLNPDALIDGAGIRGMVQFMEARPEAGAAGARLVHPDGRLQLSCRRFPSLLTVLLRTTRLERVVRGPTRSYLMQDWDHAAAREVDWVMGACAILRREALDAVGLLDEGFFMYYEDIDLCRRLWAAAWKVYYNPEVVVRHEHQRGSATLIPNRLTWEHARSLVRLFRKHRLPWF